MDRLPLDRSPELTHSLFPEFRPRAPWWGGHLQTIGGMYPRRYGLDRYSATRLTAVLPDGSGDRLLATLHSPVKRMAKPYLILLIHGVSGSEDSSYVKASAAYFLDLGYPVVRCNLRGAGPSREYCKRQYHAGSTEDLDCIISSLPAAATAEGIVAIGYSLGANILINFLAERADTPVIQAAVAVSSPLNLALTAKRLAEWDNAVFNCSILFKLKKESLKSASELTSEERRAIGEARTLEEFDDHFTAPRNGFQGASDYYSRTSCSKSLYRVPVPILVIHALDDPLVPSADYVNFPWHKNKNLFPLASRSGGHVGFQGSDHRQAWHDLCAARFLQRLRAQ
jgi:uncharacterized protein